MRNHELFIGEKVFDTEKMLVCEIVEFLNNYPNPQVRVSQENYLDYNKIHFDLDCEEDGMEWLTDESSIYQFVPDRVDSRESMPICYEHCEEIGEEPYPYYSPYLNENLYEIETDRV